MPNNNIAIGKNIKKARNEKHMTQAELANKCYVANTVISAYENDKKTPTLDTLINLSTALDVSLDYLCFGEESEAILNRPSSEFRKIVNCFNYLCNIKAIKQVNRNGSTELVIEMFSSILNRLFPQLDQFHKSKDLYPDPDAYLENLLQSSANEMEQTAIQRANIHRDISKLIEQENNNNHYSHHPYGGF